MGSSWLLLKGFPLIARSLSFFLLMCISVTLMATGLNPFHERHHLLRPVPSLAG